MNSERIIIHWIESSDHDFKTMNDLYQTQNNNWALFMGHLVIEKLLKALFIKLKDEFPPMIHDLRRLCEKADIDLDDSRKILLDSISRFNINARYDDYKQSFYQLCTESFTAEWIDKIKDCRLWIKEML
ncbi:MAG: HEPN domain-containing protein [Mariniphaga sp.]|nr:HEPN domain-containing protein [Mariniphaga sp.]